MKPFLYGFLWLRFVHAFCSGKFENSDTCFVVLDHTCVKTYRLEKASEYRKGLEHPPRRMASCRLCGYTARLDKNAVAQQQQEQCVVCGEAFGGDDGRRSGGATQQAASLLAHAGGAIWRGASPKQEMSQPPVPAMGRCVGAETNQSSWLNPELRLLLDLVPQQQNRRKRTQDSVRAIGNLTPPRVDEVPSDPEVVFIRPRADPTMRVLKVDQKVVRCDLSALRGGTNYSKACVSKNRTLNCLSMSCSNKE